MKKSDYKFIMLSAMYENGGNTTHRLLDGHPELFVYPFESQPGTKYVNDFLSSLYPLKYRWPIFPSSSLAEEVYEQIIDEEGKVRAKTPYVSKFRTADIQMTDKDRKNDFLKFLKGKELSRANIMEAFFRATFTAWKNYKETGKEKAWVGYSPIIGVDGDKIIEDYKGNGHVFHVVRNPFSAYADTKKRAVPLSIPHYMMGWVTCQYFSLMLAEKYPDHYHIIKFEDLVKDKVGTLAKVLKKVGIGSSKTLEYPSWHGEELKEVYPWGTVRIPTEEANLKTAKELSKDEIKEIYLRTKEYIDIFKLNDFYKKVK
ncbi:MAG TPA: sulfotransferase [Bacteroidia bacterium]|nr:sulfotransferase [Bacteroidia bacterium]